MRDQRPNGCQSHDQDEFPPLHMPSSKVQRLWEGEPSTSRRACGTIRGAFLQAVYAGPWHGRESVHQLGMSALGQNATSATIGPGLVCPRERTLAPASSIPRCLTTRSIANCKRMSVLAKMP